MSKQTEKHPPTKNLAGDGFALADLSPGQQAMVVQVNDPGPAGRRLLDLGLVPGTRVASLRRSPLGDPTAYAIRGAVIALRRDTARQIAIWPLGP